jgi:hypothetical protein
MLLNCQNLFYRQQFHFDLIEQNWIELQLNLHYVFVAHLKDANNLTDLKIVLKKNFDRVFENFREIFRTLFF